MKKIASALLFFAIAMTGYTQSAKTFAPNYGNVAGIKESDLKADLFILARHPTLKKESIIAVLNSDMIGRNHTDSAALMGLAVPHRYSAELVRMAMDANREGPRFKLDTLWDKKEHPEGWYFRSDHLPYARAGIPSLFYTALLHPDYHTPIDEADRIDLKKLAKMTMWMYRTWWKAANSLSRPKADPDFRLER